MEAIRIDADALFRAMTATGYKLLAYNLDLRTGEIVSRTLSPDQVKAGPEAPSVKPLPKMGGDLAPKKDTSPFGPPPVASNKPKLFAEDDAPKKAAFDSGFWKRDDKKKPDIFGEFKRESGSKKLAEIFQDAPKSGGAKKDPFAKSEEPGAQKASRPPSEEIPPPESANDPYYPRIPAISEATHLDWMRQFARDCGDPTIRDELLGALNASRPSNAFERALRNHLRMGQQWEGYLRKQALATADAWLASINVNYELIESTAH
jgi:hypothetical protein